MDRDRLAELRKKKAQAKAKQHTDLLESNASIKEAVLALHKAINDQEPYDDSQLIQQLKELKQHDTYSEDIKRLEASLKDSSDKDKLDEIIKAVGNINNTDVVKAVNNLIVRLEEKTVKQNPDDFQPVRRVRKIGSRLVFDDDPLQVSVMGGSGAGIQSNLIDDNRVKVVVDGIEIPPIELGTVGLTDTDNQRINPATLEGQEDIVTAIENITVPPPVGGATEAKQDTIISELESIEGNQLPDNHQVTVSNFPATQPVSGTITANKGTGWVDPQTNALTDAELRATPIPVSASIDTTGLATEEKQDEIIEELQNLEVEVDTAELEETLTNGTQIVGSESLIKTTATASASGDNTIYTPASGNFIRLYFFGYSAGSNVEGVLASLKFDGGSVFDQQYLVAAGQPYARNIQAGKRYIEGGIDEALVLNLSQAQTVYANIELSEVTP